MCIVLCINKNKNTEGIQYCNISLEFTTKLLKSVDLKIKF